MKRCKHEMFPLVPRPVDADDVVLAHWKWCPAMPYVRCKHCCRIGWYTRHKRRLKLVSNQDDADRLAKAAVDFTKWLHSRNRGES